VVSIAIALAYLYQWVNKLFIKQDNYIDTPKPQKTPIKKEVSKENSLKEQGDAYEHFIGKQFEEKGYLVIYNGFIRGFEDGGVDLVAISADAKILYLIQCKNWQKMTMQSHHLETLYHKLQIYNFDFLSLSIEEIKMHLSIPKEDKLIKEIILKIKEHKETLTIHQILYLSNEKVVSLEMGQYLSLSKNQVLKYKKMKIVVENMA